MAGVAAAETLRRMVREATRESSEALCVRVRDLRAKRPLTLVPPCLANGQA